MSTKNEDTNTINIISHILSIFGIFLAGIIFSSFLFFKPKLSSLDSLITVKYFVQFSFFTSFLIISVYNQSNEEENGSNYGNIPHMSVGINIAYLSFIYTIDFFINYENYLGLSNPVHIIRNFIRDKEYYLTYYLTAAISILIIEFASFITDASPSFLDFFLQPGYNVSFTVNKILPIFLLLNSLSKVYFFVYNKRNFKVMKFQSSINFSYNNYFMLLTTTVFYFQTKKN